MEYLGNGYFRTVINGFITVGTPEDIKEKLEEAIKFYEEEIKK